MQIRQQRLLGFIGAPGVQLMIPAYQRPYSWTRDQCFELWLDIQRAARSGNAHFAGTVLFSSEQPCDGMRRIAVIDGQQRVTTATLLLAALCRYLRESGQNLPGASAADLAAAYLSLPSATGPRPKLVLSRTDHDTLRAVVGELAGFDVPAPAQPARNIIDNLAFFAEQMADPAFDVQALWRGLGLLDIIGAEVDDPDQAQLVFESLNSKGRPLTVADLVRNYLLLSESRAEQARLYREYWVPMQELFAPDPGSLRLDSAIKGWLAVRFRKTRMRSPELVYSGFKQYAEDTYEGTKEDLLCELRGFCLVWAENYRFHAVKKFKSSHEWAINGAPTLTAGYQLKKADNEEYAARVRAELKAVDARW